MVEPVQELDTPDPIRAKFYSFDAVDMAGKTRKMSEFEGQAICVINTARKSSLIPHLQFLQRMFEKYEKNGFIVLGFPCNQFGSQEPGTNEEINEYYTKEQGITFPLFQKISVNTDKAHPLWEYMKAEKRGLLWTKAIKWNFTKFLISKEGEVTRRTSPKTAPKDFESDIVKMLA